MGEIERVGVIGMGYIGLPTAVAFASRGTTVLGVDVRESVVTEISSGRAHLFEPGLDELVATCVEASRLSCALTPEPCDAFILAVPTPFKEGYVPDLSYVDAATDSIAPVLRAGNIVILESTSPVGTTERVAQRLAQARPDLRFPSDGADGYHNVHVAHCPERVLPGNILHELVHNERIVGGIAPCCSEESIALYRKFVEAECFATSARTAEMSKLAENAFRDVNIAFANELSIICHHLGIDVSELIGLANRHPRVRILKPGAGVGGHCIAVDPWFIVNSAPEQSPLIRTARLVNDSKSEWVANMILGNARERGIRRVGCLGLSYKADVDDMRESPSIRIVEQLCESGQLEVFVHDPFIQRLPKELEGTQARFCGLSEILERAELLALLTDHQVYRKLPVASLTDKVIVDPTAAWTGHHGRSFQGGLDTRYGRGERNEESVPPPMRS